MVSEIIGIILICAAAGGLMVGILKLIDSFKTNKTYNSNSMHDTISRNKIIKRDKNEVCKIRKDGAYLCHVEGISQHGEPYKLSIWLFFNHLGFVFIENSEGLVNFEAEKIQEYVNYLADLSSPNQLATTFSCYSNQIKMKFKESPTQADEYVGTVHDNFLILKRKVHYRYYLTGETRIDTTHENMKFIFTKGK